MMPKRVEVIYIDDITGKILERNFISKYSYKKSKGKGKVK